MIKYFIIEINKILKEIEKLHTMHYIFFSD